MSSGSNAPNDTGSKYSFQPGEEFKIPEAVTDEELHKSVEELVRNFDKLWTTDQFSHNLLTRQRLAQILLLVCSSIRNKDPNRIFSILHANGIDGVETRGDTSDDFETEKRAMLTLMSNPEQNIPLLLQALGKPFGAVAPKVAQQLNMDFPLDINEVKSQIEKSRRRAAADILAIMCIFPMAQERVVAGLAVLLEQGKTRGELVGLLEDMKIPPDVAQKRIAQAEQMAEKDVGGE